LPFFIGEMVKFFKTIYCKTESLSDSQKRDIAEYLIPDVDKIFRRFFFNFLGLEKYDSISF